MRISREDSELLDTYIIRCTSAEGIHYVPEMGTPSIASVEPQIKLSKAFDE